MTKTRRNTGLYLLGIGTAALLWTSCVVRGSVTFSGPPLTMAPPRYKVVKRCPPGFYVRGGGSKWNARARRYVRRPATCVRRPAAWKANCRWVRGRYVKTARGYKRMPGRRVCGGAVVRPTLVVRRNPPAPPVMSVRCGPNQYARGGKYVWRGNRWTWTRAVCVARPRTYRSGCKWQRGRTARVGKRWS